MLCRIALFHRTNINRCDNRLHLGIFGPFTVCVDLRIKHIRLCGAKLNCGMLIRSLSVFHAVQHKILYNII